MARPLSAPPSVLRTHGAADAAVAPDTLAEQHDAWTRAGATIVVAPPPHPPHSAAPFDAASPGAGDEYATIHTTSSVISTDGRTTDIDSTNFDSAFGGFETVSGAYADDESLQGRAEITYASAAADTAGSAYERVSVYDDETGEETCSEGMLDCYGGHTGPASVETLTPAESVQAQGIEGDADTDAGMMSPHAHMYDESEQYVTWHTPAGAES